MSPRCPLKTFSVIISYISPPVHTVCFPSREREPKIIEYQTQQYKLFPGLALAHALLFASRGLLNQYMRANPEIQSGNYDTLPDVRFYEVSCLIHTHCIKRVKERNSKMIQFKIWFKMHSTADIYSFGWRMIIFLEANDIWRILILLWHIPSQLTRMAKSVRVRQL